MKWNYDDLCRTFEAITDKVKALDCASFVRSDEKLLKIWRKASSLGDFLKAVRQSYDKGVLFSDFSVFFWGRVQPDWYYRRSYCAVYARYVFKTSSDVGSLKIGVNGMDILISNHYGDGINRVAIFNNPAEHEDCAVSHLFPYSDVTVKGKDIKVYAYDCGDEVAWTLDGTWHIYSDDRFFALVKWAD